MEMWLSMTTKISAFSYLIYIEKHLVGALTTTHSPIFVDR